MKTNLYFLALLTIVLLFSCKKETETEQIVEPTPTIINIEDVTAPFDFDWSTSKSGGLQVSLQPTSGLVISTKDQLLLLIDENDNILSKAKIIDSKASFAIKLPYDIGDVYLMYPNSANKQKLTKLEGEVVMPIAPQPRDNTKNGLFYDRKFAFEYQKKLSKFLPNKNANSSNLCQNGEFDIDNLEKDSRSWTALRTPGKWYYTNNDDGHVTNINGENVFKNYNNSYEVIEQSFPVLGGSAFDFSMEFSGSLNLWLDNFDSSGKWIGETYVTTTNNSISSSGVILQNATHFQFYVGLYTNSYVDKIIYQSVDVVLDTDGDGVNDNGDDYPNNPNKAYKIMYPTTGYQTLAFEDLWPYKGDYDFNDLVVTMQGELSVNADGHYVDAILDLSIDAAGGSTPLGFGCNIVDGEKNTINTTIVSNLTGNGHLDNDVNNGIIFFDNKFDEMIPYYTNTTYDKVGTPVELSTTISFSGNYTGALMPNYYIFKTNERGAEVHLPNYPPTEAANIDLFGTGSDNKGTPYRTETGLPWAIDVVTTDKSYKHSLEGVKITDSYKKFGNWAVSSGANDKDWKESPENGTVFIP